jgi:hypothetical protein
MVSIYSSRISLVQIQKIIQKMRLKISYVILNRQNAT